MRADNDGESGIMALIALIIVVLFMAQRLGTGAVGRVFGPVMAVWFTVLAALGVRGIVAHPAILEALSPTYALGFLVGHFGTAFFSLTAVVLAVTGAEALYADMGHFGRGPVRRAWLLVVFPACILNYLGQGALILGNPASISNPFFQGPDLRPLNQLAAAGIRPHARAGVPELGRAGLRLRHRRDRHHLDHDSAVLLLRPSSVALATMDRAGGQRHPARYRPAVLRRQPDQADPWSVASAADRPDRVHHPHHLAAGPRARHAEAEPRGRVVAGVHRATARHEAPLPRVPGIAIFLNRGTATATQIPGLLPLIRDAGIEGSSLDGRLSYFVSRIELVQGHSPGMSRWRKRLFIATSRITADAAESFRLPHERTVIMGSRIEL
jgi:hypothetical protein